MNNQPSENNDDIVIIPAPPESVFIEYRLYYDENGSITACAMVQHPPGDNYIVVDRDVYDNYMRYCVKDGKLEKIKQDSSTSNSLRKSTSGYKIVSGHAPLIIYGDEDYTEIEYYDRI